MGLDTKTYWLTDRQSQCDFDFDLTQLVSGQFSKSLYREDFEVWIGEDVKCELKALFGVCDPDCVMKIIVSHRWEIDWKDWHVMIVKCVTVL
jgi:hypothetical protein